MPVPLHNHYVEAFESRFGLTETERDFMKSAGIRSPRQLRMLLAHTPNLRDLPQAKSGLFRYVHLLHCSGGELRTDSETHRGRLVAGVNLSDTDIGIVATLPLHNATGGMPLSPRATTDVKKIGLRAIANADRANVIANPKRLYLDGKPGLARRWPARDQGTQNSCTAFAVAACLEFLGADEINPILPLSAAFLYNFSKDFAKLNKNAPAIAVRAGATRLSDARKVIISMGICDESLWPYNGPQPSLGELAGDIKIDANKRKKTSAKFDYWNHEDDKRDGIVNRIYKWLKGGVPVAVSVPLFNPGEGSDVDSNWDTTTALATGFIQNPIATWEPLPLGHVVCLTGFQPSNLDPLGGLFEFRNSKGDRFATQPHLPPIGIDDWETPGVGYGLISASYVQEHAWEIMSIKK